ncbi:hypothetical protein F4604DRAFT_1675023 [Suillus subluteus]|nr:hypothetical protein F4604DRAFT_1675023 [Suillus subluteus]
MPEPLVSVYYFQLLAIIVCRDEYEYPQSDIAASAFCVTFFSRGNDQKISQWILPSTGPVLTKPLVKVGHWHKGKLSMALEIFTRCIKADSSNYVCFRHRSVIHAWMHDWEFALKGTFQSINIHKSSTGYMAIAHYGLNDRTNSPVHGSANWEDQTGLFHHYQSPAYHLNILGRTNIRVQELADVIVDGGSIN